MTKILVTIALLLSNVWAFEPGETLLLNKKWGWSGLFYNQEFTVEKENWLEYDTSNKLASVQEISETKNWIQSISPTLTGDEVQLHLEIYRGLLSTRKLPIFIKTATADYDALTTSEKLEDTLMDYYGGLLNIRIDLQDIVIRHYDSDLKNFDSLGASLQAGLKYSTFDDEHNKSTDIVSPYMALPIQVDVSLFNHANVDQDEGYLNIGVIPSVQYLSKDYRGNLFEGYAASDIQKWVTKLDAYANINITNRFGIKFSYSMPINEKLIEEKTYVSLVISGSAD